jgi:putative oxidoreductase
MVMQSKNWNIGLWVLQGLAAIAFVGAGAGKLTGAEQMVQMFDTIGFGQWFRYLTGAIEVGGAALLLVPKTTAYAAAMLAATMIGAIATHLFIIGGSPAIPVVLLAITGVIAWRRGLMA